MRILFFGKLGQTVGREIHIEPPPGGCTVAELRGLLAQRYPHADADLRTPALRACIQDTIVGEQVRVAPGAEVEFFPPLSGG